jgi:hypothetical protein
MIDLNTRAVLIHVNARKEGPADDKVPALDVKLEATMSADILVHFHGQLRGFLFNGEGEPRFTQMAAVKWTGGVRQVLVAIAGLRVYGDLRKWWFSPTLQAPFALTVGFTLTFRPSGTEASTLVELLGEQVAVRTINEDQLPLGTTTAEVVQAVQVAEKLQALAKLKAMGGEDKSSLEISDQDGPIVTISEKGEISIPKRRRKKAAA